MLICSLDERSPRRTTLALSETDLQDAPAKQRPRHPIIYYWGLAVLLGGLVGAAFIYAFAADDEDMSATREITSGRMYQHNIELMGGKFAVLSAEFNQWFGSLWQGRPLAYTVAVVAVGIALVCFWAGHLMSTLLPREADRKRNG